MNTTTTPSAALQGACHCGAVRLTLPFAPDKATDCNCSICRRIAGLWAYYEFGTVRIEGHPQNTEGYVWGDKTLRTVRCKSCGIVTHWEPLEPQPGQTQDPQPREPQTQDPQLHAPQPQKHGVNLRNFDPALLASVPVRRFDGADTWTFID
jgi:hypothetical protein